MKRVLVPQLLSSPEPVPADMPIETLGGATMGTDWSVKLACPPDTDLAALRKDIESILDRIIAQMSSWENGSDISRFNRAAAGSLHQIPDDFAKVLDCALTVARQSEGVYDPTIAPLVDLWGFGPRAAGTSFRTTPPSKADIAKAREYCGWQHLQFSPETHSLLQPGGMALDLSAIAKGYGVDCIAEYLQSRSIPAFLVEIGGELRGAGIKPDGTPWWVELESPLAENAAPLVVALYGLSVATSGDYRRYFEHDGMRYAHSIDPRTGWPVSHGLASVTVLHQSCMWADALSTALTVLGPDAGMAYARAHTLPALFVLRTQTGLKEVMSPAMAALLH